MPTQYASSSEAPSDLSISGPWLAGGRTLPGLVFLTNMANLARNIGGDEVSAIFDEVSSHPNIQVVDSPSELDTPEQVSELVRPLLASSRVDGVVIVGGYDVIPPQRLDVLDAALRQVLDDARLIEFDADNFYVWSDDLYGDSDGDLLPEVPVSRIPDGRAAAVVRGALQATTFVHGRQFGIRNLLRPFAADVFTRLPGHGSQLEVSEVFASHDVPSGAAAGAVYYMLHGDAHDGTRFWGETSDQKLIEAMFVGRVPEVATGTVVFSGCCWGALPHSPTAFQCPSMSSLQPRTATSSIAIAYLQAGAVGFVGCTGCHYSPHMPPYDFYGKPMHDAFWEGISAGLAPAEALLAAKIEYAMFMPHGRNDPFSHAIELKTLRQFTCLGLGW